MFTYSYSNLFDGGLRRVGGFSDFEVIQAVEESFSLWAQAAPLTFIEVADSGPEPSDTEYLAANHPDIRIGHHGLDGNTLAHAYFSGPSGLSGDVHLDSSDRVWSESLFLTTVTHELGHVVGLDHIDDEVAVMNSTIGSANTFSGLGAGRLLPPDLRAIRELRGVGSGEVITERRWRGNAAQRWDTDAAWNAGFRPTKHANVYIDRDAEVLIDSPQQSARNVTLGGGTNSLQVALGGSLTVTNDLVLGDATGGNVLLASGALARTWVPSNGELGATWIEATFDDTDWQSGPTGIGFDRTNEFDTLIGTDLESSLFNRGSSFYTRLEFDVADPSALDFMTLRMKYDDGFVAYLNGTRIASDNSPASPTWNSRATANRDDSDAADFTDYTVSDFQSLLQPGRNLLAIQGLNRRTDSSDMLILPEIVAGHLDHRLQIDGGELNIERDLRLGDTSGSQTLIELRSGRLQVAGNVTTGPGSSVLDMHGGTLQVDGGLAPNNFITESTSIRWTVPANGAEDEVWREVAFDDRHWTEGEAAIGYDANGEYADLIHTDVESSLSEIGTSLYTRIPFQVSDPALVDSLVLQMKYDDGFVAYLNGEEIARRGAPLQTAWNSRATTSVDEDLVRDFVSIPLDDFAGLLQPGDNLLAVHGLNQTSSSSDFLIVPRMTGRQLAGTVAVNELRFSGGMLEGVTRIVGNVEHLASVLSPAATDLERKSSVLHIDGNYRMADTASLRLRLGDGPTPVHDQLRVSARAELDGTLVVDHVGADTEPAMPTERGERLRLPLIVAGSLSGEFDSVTLFGDAFTPGHQDQGLFRQLEVTPTEVALVSYLAMAGDANGDGLFNSSDFLEVFLIGEYEDEIPENSDWTDGDWDGNGDFESSDMIAAFLTGRYEQPAPAMRGAFATVPEPSVGGMWFLVVAWFTCRRSGRRQPVRL